MWVGGLNVSTSENMHKVMHNFCSFWFAVFFSGYRTSHTRTHIDSPMQSMWTRVQTVNRWRSTGKYLNEEIERICVRLSFVRSFECNVASMNVCGSIVCILNAVRSKIGHIPMCARATNNVAWATTHRVPRWSLPHDAIDTVSRSVASLPRADRVATLAVAGMESVVDGVEECRARYLQTERSGRKMRLHICRGWRKGRNSQYLIK